MILKFLRVPNEVELLDGNLVPVLLVLIGVLAKVNGGELENLVGGDAAITAEAGGAANGRHGSRVRGPPGARSGRSQRKEERGHLLAADGAEVLFRRHCEVCFKVGGE